MTLRTPKYWTLAWRKFHTGSPVKWNDRFADRTALMKRSAIRELLKVTASPEIISFAGGLPAPDLFPLEAVQAATERALARHGSRTLQYGESEGVAELRDWIADRYSRSGLQITRANVLVTHGAQQGLDLAGRVFLNPGDRVALENPTYLALLSAWRPLGVEFHGIPSDSDGMCVSEIFSRARRTPKLVYTIPNFQNPQGTTLSLARREELVRACREEGITLLEDDPYGELRFEGEELPSLLALDAAIAAPGSENVIHTGTFSKVLAPGLRLGWVIAPGAVIDKLVEAKQASDLHTSTFSQFIALDLIQSGVIETQLPRLRAEYKRRRDAMLGALRRHAPPGIGWTHPQGGMFLLMSLPPSLDATELLARALEQQVAFVPGETLHLDGEGKNTIRLNFSNSSPERIEEGIQRLLAVITSAAGTTRPRLAHRIRPVAGTNIST